jgi:hypothetical protein
MRRYSDAVTGTDYKGATALSLDLASKIVTVLDCGIKVLQKVVEGYMPQPSAALKQSPDSSVPLRSQ